MAAVAERLEEQISEQINEVEREVERLRGLLQAVREIGEDNLVALVTLAGAQKKNGNGQSDAPRGREAIRQIVSERPGIWTLAELRAEMVQRGWLTTPKAVEVATKRLCEINREGKRIGKGRYLFPADHEEGAIESDASGVAVIALT